MALDGAAPATTPQQEVYPTLGDLLTPSTTLPTIDAIDDADTATLDTLFAYLPPNIASLAAGSPTETSSSSTTTSAQPAHATTDLTPAQRKDILRRILRSPQFAQSLGSLTSALHEGGLPSIASALGIAVRNDGFERRTGQPVENGAAVRLLVEGVRNVVAREEEEKKRNGGGQQGGDGEAEGSGQ